MARLTTLQQILTIGLRTLTSCVSSPFDTVCTNQLFRMITHDIQRFSTHLAAIYANLAKPILDVVLYNYQLSQNVGAEGLVLLTVFVQASALLRMSIACRFAPKSNSQTRSSCFDASIWCLYGDICSAGWFSITCSFTCK